MARLATTEEIMKAGAMLKNYHAKKPDYSMKQPVVKELPQQKGLK